MLKSELKEKIRKLENELAVYKITAEAYGSALRLLESKFEAGGVATEIVISEKHPPKISMDDARQIFTEAINEVFKTIKRYSSERQS